MESSDTQSDNSSYDIHFLTGINWILASDYKEAIQFFLLAILETEPTDQMYPVYQSYAGLSAVMLHQPGGLQHCRHVSDLSFHRNPEIQLNLACAELLLNNRKRGIQAFDNIDISALSPEKANEIHAFFAMTGKREENEQGALKRDNFFRNSISKMFRKKIVTTENIEDFIIEIAEKRYKDAMNYLQSQLKKIPADSNEKGEK